MFKKSALKQQKFRAIASILGPTEGLDCLDIGTGNGAISYMLRIRGGNWKSADVDEGSVRATLATVGSNSFKIESDCTPFDDNAFDRVVIVDLLEHIQDDRRLMGEIHRILRSTGVVVINVPQGRHTLVRRLRLALGYTDAMHGHVRPGYTAESLSLLLGERFEITRHLAYGGTFSELVDLLQSLGESLTRGLGQGKSHESLAASTMLPGNRKSFFFFSLLYPALRLLSGLDALGQSNRHMLLVSAIPKEGAI